MNRLLTVLMVALLASPALAAPIAPGVQETTTLRSGYKVPDDAITHGPSGQPTWVVAVDDQGALDSWANESSDREVVRDIDANRSVVAASPAAIGATRVDDVLDRGLATASYVERISPNRALSLAEPVATDAIPTAENYTRPEEYGTVDRLRRGEYPDAGIAHRDDANVTTQGDVRDTIGADNVTETGAGVTVAVIDTGVNHANGTIGLQGNISPDSKDFVDGGTGVDAVSDPNGHGSWVASAIAADPDGTTDDEQMEGVAPDATILGLRVLDEDGSGSTADIAAAIRYAEAHDADVLAMSLGSQRYTPEVAAAVRDACEGNVTTVSVAAGNSRRLGSPYLASPSDVPADCVVSVAASNTSTPETAGVASFSQLGSDPAADLSMGASRGQDIDVAAPGMRVNQTVATTSEAQTYETLSGTSMAQPYVAGSVAQLLESDSSLENESALVRDRLTTTADRMPNAATVEAGHGMVAPDRAIADNETLESQADAMDDAAETRDTFWANAGSEGLLSQLAGLAGV